MHAALLLDGAGWHKADAITVPDNVSFVFLPPLHLLPETSKWNRIEHRLLATISQNWGGKPLVSHQVIVQRIGATTTQTGLTVRCEMDASRFPNGIKVTAAEMAALTIERGPFHGEWNRTISPNQQPP